MNRRQLLTAALAAFGISARVPQAKLTWEDDPPPFLVWIDDDNGIIVQAWLDRWKARTGSVWYDRNLNSLEFSERIIQRVEVATAIRDWYSHRHLKKIPGALPLAISESPAID